MRYWLFLLCFAVLPVFAEEVFFVPGWRTGFDGRELCVNVLRNIYPGMKLYVKSWDSLQPWNVAKQNAVTYTRVLLQEVLDMPESRRKQLILIGHSVGAKIVVDVLNELRRRGLKVHSSALLGGALPDNDPGIMTSLDAIQFYCCIVYNPDDWVLKMLFPLDNKMHAPLGLKGWTGSDYRVFESRARKERFGFYNHYAYIYLEELERLIKKLPPQRPVVDVMQDATNEVRVPADQIFWKDIRVSGGWKLQKLSESDKYRILDERGMRRANGSEKKMREAFADVERQLNISK